MEAINVRAFYTFVALSKGLFGVFAIFNLGHVRRATAVALWLWRRRRWALINYVQIADSDIYCVFLQPLISRTVFHTSPLVAHTR